MIRAALVAGLLWAAPAAADKTEPGSRTIWDEIMAQQAQRELIEGNSDLEQKKYGSALHVIRHAVAADPKN